MKSVNVSRVDKFDRLLDEWLPPDAAEPFTHASKNFCDAMDTGNKVLDYDATVTGTAGITGHALDQLKDHNFDTYWQSDPGVVEDDQYFELELSDAVNCDSCIMNFNIPNPYTTPPYTPDPSCWKAWTLEGKLNAGDAWTELEAVTANDIKFYEGTFTRGMYKYFRVKSISAYNNVAQDVRIDAYLYTMGIYDSTTKWYDTFPDRLRGRNDINSDPEYTNFEGHDIYITSMDVLMSDLYSMNGDLSKVVKDMVPRQYRHIGGIWSEWHEMVTSINYPHDAKLTRLNSLDFTVEKDICLYMFPPPNEIWRFVGSGYAFDETAANLNTPITLKVPDNAHKISPVFTKTREYTSFAVFGARYITTSSGEFKVNKYYVAFSDPVNMESMIRFDGQEGKGLVTDMDGTVLTPSTVVVNAVSNVNIVRLKIGDIWRGHSANLSFNPPIKLDGDNADHTYEIQKDEKMKGSILRFSLRGFKVPKPTGD
jgi:hypothetical protein